MKTTSSLNFLKCAVLLVPALVGGAAGAETATNPPVALRLAPPVVVKSVFIDDPRSGVDPFFPKSTRRLDMPDTSGLTNTAPQPSTLFKDLALKGISGVRGQRLALINSSTVGVGEQAEIRSGLQTVKIVCREIRDNSVLIELAATGEVREIKLREGI